MRTWQWIAACGITAVVAAALTSTAIAQEVPALVDKQLPDLLATYKAVHAAPELSHHEVQTAAMLAEEMRKRPVCCFSRAAAHGKRRMWKAVDEPLNVAAAPS